MSRNVDVDVDRASRECGAMPWKVLVESVAALYRREQYPEWRRERTHRTWLVDSCCMEVRLPPSRRDVDADALWTH